MEDSLGDRMKEYEATTKTFLPRRSYTIIRVDGMAFHTLTRKFKKPFDETFVSAMNETAKYLCKEISNVRFAFTQSDEISLIITDFEKTQMQAWFGNNLQKMCSASASKATSAFNMAMLYNYFSLEAEFQTENTDFSIAADVIKNYKVGEFDSRVYQIPQRTEVINYLVWRQNDTVRNSISSVAYSLYSNKELEGKNNEQKQEMIFNKGINWNDLDPCLKRGRITVKVQDGIRSKWKTIAAPEFTKEDGRKFINEHLLPNEIVPSEK